MSMDTQPPHAPNPMPLSVRLKAGTREVHEHVERTASFNRLIVVRMPGVDASSSLNESVRGALLTEYREVYRRFMVAAYGFEAGVNEVLKRSAALPLAEAAGFEFERHDPVVLIREDLLHVFGAESLEGLRLMEGLPAVRTLPELAGVEYVRRGSRAGGAVIAAVVERNLRLTREHGASFLAQYGKQTRAVLVSLKTWLDALPFSEAETEAAVIAARATFEAVQQYHGRLEDQFARV